MKQRISNVLFFCAGNPECGIMAAALLNKWGAGRFRGFSAAGESGGGASASMLELLKLHGLSIDDPTPDDPKRRPAPASAPMDFVITLCDREADEDRQLSAEGAVTARWHITKPAAHPGTSVERLEALRRAFCELENRVKLFVLVWDKARAQMPAAGLPRPEPAGNPP